MKKVAIIGAGISGLSSAHLLSNFFEVKVFEKDLLPGGLIKCKKIEDSLYHVVGGHVFNSHRKNVLEWFWSFFDKKEFTESIRNASIYLNGKFLGYPIENHLYQFDEMLMKNVISDLITIIKSYNTTPVNFEDFLRNRFGDTLYNIYFKPYNTKIWKRDLSKVPLSWLEGKLPMPSIEEIIYNNFKREKETNMVHSTFYYPKEGGSQFLANRIAENINISYDSKVESITYKDSIWTINNEYECDLVIFTGNIKELPELLQCTLGFDTFFEDISKLEYHGTTTAFCEINQNPYSWIYLPEENCNAHRIICTGNFSELNNRKGIKTATIEFTDCMDKYSITKELEKCPLHPRYISHEYTQYTYPIQKVDTKSLIASFKQKLENQDFYLVGRFAEWEYYNMDAAIGATMDLTTKIIKMKSL